MARIRSVHPNIWRQESFVSLSEAGRLMLLGLGTFSNYADRFHWDFDAISAHMGGHRPDVEMEELADAGLIMRDGDFGQILFAFGFSRRRISNWESLRAATFERDGYRCVYCGAEGVHLHCDHILPVSRGGADDLSNLATACAHCNLSKNDKTPEEWRAAS